MFRVYLTMKQVLKSRTLQLPFTMLTELACSILQSFVSVYVR